MAEDIPGYSQTSDMGDFLRGRGYHQAELTRNKAGHVQITASVNNVEGCFILDTGAGCTIIDSANAVKLNLTLQHDGAESKGAGAGGSRLEVIPSYGNTLVINDLVIEDIPLSVMNLEHVTKAYRQLGIDEVFLGVIGADILEPYKALIDYTGKQLWLKSRKVRRK